jgi:hypothetical protein
MSAALAKKTRAEEPAKPAVAAIPEIEPALVTVNGDGQAYRTIQARLPARMTAADLSEPRIWRQVQAVPRTALRKFDHLFIIAFDESWTADVLVVSADVEKAVLGKPRIESIPERFMKLFEDERYRVAWTGQGYCVERKGDGVRMTQPVHSAAIAERDLINLYPRVA